MTRSPIVDSASRKTSVSTITKVAMKTSYPSARNVVAVAQDERIRAVAEPFCLAPATLFLGVAGRGGGFWFAWLASLIVALLLCLSGCGTTVHETGFFKHDLGVVTGVQPSAVQPDLVKWRALKPGMTEAEVTALLGEPYRKDPRPAPETDTHVRHSYAWEYGAIAFESFTTKGSFRYAVTFHEGRSVEISDPWNGRFSTDGLPTVPELVLPRPGQTFDHYPRFMDFRWQPSSGVYPVEYEIEIEALSVNQSEAENFEDYVRKTVDRNRPSWKADGLSSQRMETLAASFARTLRESRGVVETYEFRTHDIYLPFTWIGANTGRWRIKATNDKGSSAWTDWRFFKFSS
jgi:hypothetical protein